MYFDEAPKTRREDLYDFDKEYDLLFRALKRGNRLIAITGLRRTGKTSLLLTALNESKIPYILLDGRVFASRAAISREDLVRILERSVNEFISREEGLARRVLDRLKAVRGVEVSLKPPAVSLTWGQLEKPLTSYTCFKS